MKNSWKLTIVILIVSSVVACKKSSTNVDPYVALTGNNSKSWGMYSKATAVKDVYYPNTLDQKDKDCRYEFNTTKRFIFSSITGYYPSDTGTWELSNNNSVLTIAGTKTHNKTLAVESITDSYIRLREEHASLYIKTEYSVK
jgi:hypothetical protein